MCARVCVRVIIYVYLAHSFGLSFSDSSLLKNLSSPLHAVSLAVHCGIDLTSRSELMENNRYYRNRSQRL